MHRRRLLSFITIVGISVCILLFRTFAPQRFDRVRGSVRDSLSWVPEPVLLVGVLVYVVITWFAALVLLAKLLYWGWRRVDELVFKIWNSVLPESPLVRFAAGLTVMIFVFGFGPLLILQESDMDSGDQDIEDRIGGNQTAPPSNETAPPAENETEQQTNSTNTILKNNIIDTYSTDDITLPAKDPYL